MGNPAVAWVKVGAIFEVVVCVAVGLMWIFNGWTGEEAQSWGLKLTAVVVLFAAAGAVIGHLMKGPQAEAPKP